MNKNDFWSLVLPAFSLGILACTKLPSLPSPTTYVISVVVLCGGLLILLTLKNIRSYIPPYVAPLFTGLLIAGIWAIGWGIYQTNNRLPIEWEGQDVTLTGYISSIPKVEATRTSFQFKTGAIINAPPAEDASINNIKVISVNWYDKPEEIEIIPGQLWRLQLRLRRPYAFMNPGGFDYEAWTLQQAIDATAYVKKDYELLESDAKFWLTKQRWRVLNKINNSKLQTKGLISALMLGDRSLISREQNLILRQSGISHLLAISGLHLTLVGGACFLLCLFLLRLFGKLTNGLISSPLSSAAGLSLLFIWSYALWTGFSLPTQRAALMLSVFLLSIIFRYFVRPWSVYFAAMALVLIIDPLAGINGGFYLSFAAVAMVIFAVKYFIPTIKPASLKIMLTDMDTTSLASKVKSYGFDLLIIQLIITGGLIPLSLLFFNEFSLIGILINLVAIPLTSFVIMPWILLSNLWLLILSQFSSLVALFPLYPLDNFMHWLYLGLEWINQYHLVLSLPSPTTTAIILAVIAIIVFIWFIKPYNYLLCLMLFLPCIFPNDEHNKIAYGELQVNVLNVGQGLAIHLQTASHQLLYDSGAGFSSGNNIGQLVIVPYLKHLGINRIDALVISHQDNDHSGGMLGIMQSIKVDKLITNYQDYLGTDKDVHAEVASNIIIPKQHEPCYKGQKWQWDGVNFAVIHPTEGSKYANRNDSSCVLLIRTGDKSLLLTGDITSRVEQNLEITKIDLLQVPHHGSKTSSSASWLATIQPQHAVFSSGYRNPYKHPAAEVVARYQQIGAVTWLSWQEGMLSFSMNNNSLKHTDSHRRSHKKYWHFKSAD